MLVVLVVLTTLEQVLVVKRTGRDDEDRSKLSRVPAHAVGDRLGVARALVSCPCLILESLEARQPPASPIATPLSKQRGSSRSDTRSNISHSRPN